MPCQFQAVLRRHLHRSTLNDSAEGQHVRYAVLLRQYSIVDLCGGRQRAWPAFPAEKILADQVDSVSSVSVEICLDVAYSVPPFLFVSSAWP